MKNKSDQQNNTPAKSKTFSRRDALKTLGIFGGAAIVGPALLRGTRVQGGLLPPDTGIGVGGEAFPTSPLILNPFTDELPIPKALAPSDPTQWKDRNGTYCPPGPGLGQQSSDGYGTHQLWPSSIIYNKAPLPNPLCYKINLQVAEHRFTNQPVQPIDVNGNLSLAPGQTEPRPLNLPGSTIYGFNGTFPGPRINAEYGKPCLVRFENWLDVDNGYGRGDFGAPDWAFLTHLHNAHTACESDGNPHYRPTAYDPWQWCDNLYLNYPAGGDDREKQSFFWFHDHRMDHTGANVYKGMVGLFPIYDPDQYKDAGIETKGYRLPGVRTNNANGSFDVAYDIPMAFYDCRLDDGITPHQDYHNGSGETYPEWWGKTFFRHYPNHGFVGDVFTVNGVAYPTLEVKRRRYRLRFLDASIARIYKFVLMASTNGPVAAKDTGRAGNKLQGQYQLPDGQQCMKFVQIASEGGLLPFALLRNSIEVWPAKRREMIVDFSKYMDGTPTTKGDVIYLVNVLQMTTGRKPNTGPTTIDDGGNTVPDPDFDPTFQVPVLRIVIGDDAVDNSFDPLDYPTPGNGLTSCALKLDPFTKLPLLKMRPTPSLPRSFSGLFQRSFRLERSGAFGGEIEWLINGLPFDPLTSLADVPQGNGELWTIQNGGGGWVHPMHLHMEEHHVLSRDGVVSPQITSTSGGSIIDYSQTYGSVSNPDPGDNSKEDVIALKPGETVVIYRKFRTFKGPYVAHCHNLAHEDHAMMFGWRII